MTSPNDTRMSLSQCGATLKGVQFSQLTMPGSRSNWLLRKRGVTQPLLVIVLGDLL